MKFDMVYDENPDEIDFIGRVLGIAGQHFLKGLKKTRRLGPDETSPQKPRLLVAHESASQTLRAERGGEAMCCASWDVSGARTAR
jgi:hypothetical protein